MDVIHVLSDIGFYVRLEADAGATGEEGKSKSGRFMLLPHFSTRSEAVDFVKWMAKSKVTTPVNLQ